MNYHLPLRQVYYGIGYLQYVDCLTLKYFVLHFCPQKILARIFTGFLTFFGAVFEGKCQTQDKLQSYYDVDFKNLGYELCDDTGAEEVSQSIKAITGIIS